MVHKIYYLTGRRFHGNDLVNVRVACRTIVKQAQSVDRNVAQESDDLCESCAFMDRPSQRHSTLYVREAHDVL